MSEAAGINEGAPESEVKSMGSEGIRECGNGFGMWGIESEESLLWLAVVQSSPIFHQSVKLFSDNVISFNQIVQYFPFSK